MNNIIALGLALLIIILNGLLGHFFPPNSIFLTPIILTITSILVCFATKNIPIVFISILTISFVVLNDIFIKLYAGGIHDNEGQDFITLFLFIGLLPACGVLIAAIFKRKEEGLINKIIAMVLFFGFTAIHLQLFGNLGLGRSY